MTSTIKTRLAAILNEWLAPDLTPLDFRKNNGSYHKSVGCITWVVDIQQSRLNSTHSTQFTLNCGVFLPTATAVFLNRPEKSRIDLTDCCVHVRIGMLAPDMLDKWWILQSNDDVKIVDRMIGEDMQCRLRDHVIPFLGLFGAPEILVKFLTTPRVGNDKFVWPQSEAIALRYAASISSFAGSSEEASLYFQKALDSANESSTKDAIRRVRDRVLAEPTSQNPN